MMVPSGSRAAASAAHQVIAPNLSKKALAPIAAVALFIAVAAATHFLHGRMYYPHVVVEAQENVRLEFLQQGLRKDEACQAAVTIIADAIRASCSSCRIAIRQCAGNLEPAYEKLLSEDPIEMPSSRLPQGVVTYLSDNQALALAACRETERLTGANGGTPAVCFPPHDKHPFPLKQRGFELGRALTGLMSLLLASLPAFLGGITEDVTKNVGTMTRLLLTMLAAAFGVWLLGAVIPRLDIPGFDTLLKWAPFAIAFTMFAVGGVA